MAEKKLSLLTQLKGIGATRVIFSKHREWFVAETERIAKSFDEHVKVCPGCGAD